MSQVARDRPAGAFDVPRATDSAPAPESVVRPSRRRLVVAAAVLGALLPVLALALLSATTDRPLRAGVNGTAPVGAVASPAAGQSLCQAALVPAGTAAVRVWLAAAGGGATVRVSVHADGRPQFSGRGRVAAAGATTVRLGRALQDDVGGSVCVEPPAAGGSAADASADGPALVAVLGNPAGGGLLALDGKPIPGTAALEFERADDDGPLTAARLAGERLGLIRGAFGGGWRGPAILLALAAGIALAVLTLAGAGRRSSRATAALCAAVAVLNAGAWSLLTPVFQVPDEPAHLSYVQDLVERGQAPKSGNPALSEELDVLIAGTQLGLVNFNPAGRPPWLERQDEALAERLEERPNRRNFGSYQPVVDYPPLYYGGLTPIYAATTALGGSSLDAITPLRGLSALLAGVTVAALLGLLLELLPGRRELAAGVALACAFLPVLTWISGAVNPDALLIALGAVIFWLFARAFGRGATPRLMLALGLALAAAMLTKIAGAGFLPGWLVGAGLLVWRRAPAVAGARRGLVVAAALGLGVPLLGYALLNTLVWDRPLIPGAVGARGGGGGAVADTSGFLTYLWQYLAPPVGGMADFFRAPWTVKDMWVPQWVGKFGWYDYEFPTVVNRAALLAFAAIGVAALVALAGRVRRDRSALAQFGVFALLAAGLTLVIARAGFAQRQGGNFIFEQARYLMPLVGCYALALGLALSLLGRRAERIAVVALVSVAVAHLLGAFALTLERYYL